MTPLTKYTNTVVESNSIIASVFCKKKCNFMRNGKTYIFETLKVSHKRSVGKSTS